MSKEAIRLAFIELREYIKSPQAYSDYHSTTPDGMCIFVDQLEASVNQLPDAPNEAMVKELRDLAYSGSRFRENCWWADKIVAIVSKYEKAEEVQ